MNTHLKSLYLVLGAAMTVAACGGGGTPRSTDQQSAVASEEPSSMATEAETAPAEEASGACAILSRQQVDTVIPGNDGGTEQDVSEAALLTDVDMGHCRYLHVEDMNLKYLDLIVYKASSDEGFEQISIGKWAHQGSSRALDIGDLGFLLDMSDQNQMMATASKGKTVFELTLSSDDAGAKSEQLIGLARIVGEKI